MRSSIRTAGAWSAFVFAVVFVFFSLAILLYVVGERVINIPGDYSLPLGNGYSFSRTNAESRCICSCMGGPGDTFGYVPPNIFAIAFHDSIVIGQSRTSSREHSVEGYFIFDIKSGNASYGLKRFSWEKTLKTQYGISDYSLSPPRDAYDKWKESD